MVRAAGAVLIENDIYSELRYEGVDAPRLKTLDPDVILLGSFSKIAFPGAARRLDHRPEAAHCPRHRTQAVGRPAHRPAFAGIPARVCPIRPLWKPPRTGMSPRAAKSCAPSRPPAPVISRLLRSRARRRHERVGRASCRDGRRAPCAASPVRTGSTYLPGRYFSISRPLDAGLSSQLRRARAGSDSKKESKFWAR